MRSSEHSSTSAGRSNSLKKLKPKSKKSRGKISRTNCPLGFTQTSEVRKQFNNDIAMLCSLLFALTGKKYEAHIVNAKSDQWIDKANPPAPGNAGEVYNESPVYRKP